MRKPRLRYMIKLWLCVICLLSSADLATPYLMHVKRRPPLLQCCSPCDNRPTPMSIECCLAPRERERSTTWNSTSSYAITKTVMTTTADTADNPDNFDERVIAAISFTILLKLRRCFGQVITMCDIFCNFSLDCNGQSCLDIESAFFVIFCTELRIDCETCA